MKKQYKLIFAILFGFNVLLAVVDIVIGASLPAIFLPASSAIWIAMYYKSLKDYTELMNEYHSVCDAHIQAATLHCKALDIIKEGLTREWASPEEFEKWQDEKMNELFGSEE
jgi:hypothetical protein